MTITFASHQLELLPQRAILIRELQAVLVSDVHLGKGAHFRRNGIPVTDGAFKNDLTRLETLVQETGCHLYVVGDLVHSTHNEEWHRFSEAHRSWNVELTLVTGNHDRYAEQHADELGISVCERVRIGNVMLVHDAKDIDGENSPGNTMPGNYSHSPGIVLPGNYIVGHVHPAVRLPGIGRLPCFHIRDTILTLPAFGRFTGKASLQVLPGDEVYVCTEDAVVEVPSEVFTSEE
mgnify:CR=1 FL=1